MRNNLDEFYQHAAANSYRTTEWNTMYFIGVTTNSSSIMRVFPEWAQYLNLGDVKLDGINLSLHDKPENYRKVLSFIKNDPQSLGALVTTHKIDMLKSCRDIFDVLGPDARLMNEISSISKEKGQLIGKAKDPVTSGLAYEHFLPGNHFSDNRGYLFIMGAGWATIALTSYLLRKEENDTPKKIIISNRSPQRLKEIEKIHNQLSLKIPVDYKLTPAPEDNDTLMETLPPGSLVVNGTGLGKDAPGSPVTDNAIFPENGIVWDFNYRGELVFLEQAGAQKNTRDLQIEDGWVYFLHGWTRVIAEVFHHDIPVSGPVFEELSRIAKSVR